MDQEPSLKPPYLRCRRTHVQGMNRKPTSLYSRLLISIVFHSHVLTYCYFLRQSVLVTFCSLYTYVYTTMKSNIMGQLIFQVILAIIGK